MTKTVSIVGLGYIGLPMACLVANKCNPQNYKILGVDINAQVVQALKEGTVPFYEPGLQESALSAIANGLSFSTEVQKSDIYVICVPTPFVEDGSYAPDLKYVYAVLGAISKLGPHSCTIIIESTCPVGTTQSAKEYLLREFGPDFTGEITAAYCPERGIPGNTLYEMEYNPRLIGGEDARSKELVADFYSQFIEGPLHITDSKVAEMSKLSENSFRDVNIAFANELAILAKSYGISPKEVIKFANLHPRVNILSPGIGVGGHCIPVDPWFLISDNPKNAKLLAIARQIDADTQKLHITKIAQTIYKALSTQESVNVLLWGLAFKPNVDDVRESPAVNIAEQVAKIFSHNENVKITCIEPHYNHLKDEHSLSPLLNISEEIPTDKEIAKAINIELVNHDKFQFLINMQNLLGYDACYMGVAHA